MTHQFAPTFPSLAHMPLLDVLRLIRTLNVGPITFFHLIQRFGTAAAALDALPEMSLRGGRRSAIAPSGREEAQAEIAAVKAFGARMILYGAPEYPALLHTISDPPPVITVSGFPHLWQNKPLAAVVGARNASANGCAFARRIAADLGEAGITVVSGLARGIDTFAHQGALAKGTVGVIAGGIDNIYPPENASLFESMRESGAIISEQPFGSVPFSGSFPGRNRIIAGMSLATVVVEASPKSGSLITARFAAEQGREVFAVPGSPLDPRSRGCNSLLKDGANMLESAQDVIAAIGQYRNRRLEEAVPPVYHQQPSRQQDAELAEARNILLTLLSPTPTHVDALIAQTGIPTGLVMTVLLELELAGRLVRMAGGKIYLIADMEELLRA